MIRGQAVNPATHAAWLEVVENTIQTHGITQDLIYGCDEVGFNPALTGKMRAIRPRGAKNVYQRGGGKRETLTTIVTICADGTAPPPSVIFKI